MNTAKKNRKVLCVLAAILALAGAGGPSLQAKAAEVYTVDVVPCYQHPVTGVEEDTGHNPGLGQSMVEAQVQSTGLVEIDDDGTIWLTARWNMVDTQTNVSFNIQTWGDSGWEPVDYEVVRQVQDEYVVTDFRIHLNTLDDIVRATNYVEPMGREVIFYYYLQNLVEGSGDFETNIQTANVDTLVESMQAAEEAESGTSETTTSGSSGTTTSSGSSGTAATTTKKAATSTKSSKSDGTKSISNKTAKTTSAEDLLDSASGIDGEDTEETTATGGQSTNPLLLTAATAGGATGGALIGGGIVAAIALHHLRKKREADAAYLEVDAARADDSVKEAQDNNER